jgi:hypothetical protein
MNIETWQQLSADLQKESALLGERNNPDSLKRVYEEGKAALLTEGDRIIAFIAIWDTGVPGWLEFGSLWVAAEHRDKKLGSKMFGILDALYIGSDQVFIITHNPKVVHLALLLGYTELNAHTWETVPWNATCGPCDRYLTTEDKLRCPYKAVASECRLLYK